MSRAITGCPPGTSRAGTARPGVDSAQRPRTGDRLRPSLPRAAAGTAHRRAAGRRAGFAGTGRSTGFAPDNGADPTRHRACRRGGAGRILLVATAWLLLLGSPLLLWLRITAERQEEAARQWEERRQRHLTATIDALAGFADEEALLGRFLAERLQPISQLTDPLPAVVQLARQLAARQADRFEFLLLDGAGNARLNTGRTDLPRVLVRRFIKDYRAYLAGDGEAIDRQRSFIRTWLGPTLPVGRPLHDRLWFAGGGATRRYLFLTRPTARFTLLVRIRLPGERRPVLLEQVLPGFHQRQSRVQATLLHLGHPVPPLAGASGPARASALPPDFLEPIGAECRATPQRLIRRADGWWYLTPLTGGWSLLGRLTPDPGHPAQRPSRSSINRYITFDVHTPATGSVLCLVLMAAGWWCWRRGSWFVPVRVRLTATFGYAAGLPVLLLLASLAGQLAERGQVLTTQRQQEVTAALVGFDRSFPLSWTHLGSQLTRDFGRLRYDWGQPVASLGHALEELGRRHGWSALRVYDSETRILHEQTACGRDDVDLNLFRVFSRIAQASLLTLRDLGQAEPDPRRPPPKLQNTSGLGADLFGRSALSLNFLSHFDLADGRFVSGIFPVRNRRGRVTLMACVLWSRERLEDLYLQRTFATCARRVPDTRLLAIHLLQPTRTRPRRSIRHPRLADFARRVRSGGQAATDRLLGRERGWLLTGILSTELAGFRLLGISDDRWIRQELNQQRLLVSFLALTLLVSTSTIGGLLARRLLDPIAHLLTGVAALERRDFTARIPRLADDELGDLAAAFNATIEDAADLEVARTVQDTLFPDGVTQAGAWRLTGRSKAGGRVGAEFFDHFGLDDGRGGLALGSVDDPGIAGALVVAMAATVVGFHRPQFDGAQVLADIDRVCRRTFGGKTGFSGTVGVTAPAPDRLCLWSNRAEPVFRVRGDGATVAWVGHAGAAGKAPPDPGFALGGEAAPTAEPTRGATPAVLRIDPGETLLLFSPGWLRPPLVGTTDLPAAAWCQGLPDLVDPDPTATLTRIFAAADRATAADGGSAHAVDLTVLLVRRDADPAPASESPT